MQEVLPGPEGSSGSRLEGLLEMPGNKVFLPLAPDKRGQRQFGNLLEKKNRLGRTLIQYFA